MANAHAINPYQRLKDKFREFARKVVHPRRTTSAVIDPKAYGLAWLRERIIAANPCGRECVIEAREDGQLAVVLREKAPDWPLSL